jgi:lysine decarboxylase/arginine decarboxylase
MSRYHDLPALVVDQPEHRAPGTEAAAIEDIVAALQGDGLEVMRASGLADARLAVHEHPELGCVLIEVAPGQPGPHLDLVQEIRARNDHLPIFLIVEEARAADLPLEVLGAVQGSIWPTEDTPQFLAGRVAQAVERYLEDLYPPFFAALARFVEQYKYSWHTPGHMGGLAFRKSPVGRRFFDFFGENAFRADLSASVPDLGSVLEHQGVVADAETEAARVFGADRTWFVSNGTTMSNQVVFRGTVRAGDVVVLDRNCHKSVLNAVIQTGAVPVWLLPLRNAHGMIGPIRPSELNAEAISAKVAANPLIAGPARVRMAVVTNSTYDGTMYHTHHVVHRLAEVAPIVHFDEAWIPYAAFHPVYRNHFAMSPPSGGPGAPTVFSTTSTHKMLASFSQGSMIHLRQGRVPIDPRRFNEAFMMHASTSPQYGIVASLDVATRMMEGAAGRALMADCLQEAVAFRQELTRVATAYRGRQEWFFECWQPDELSARTDDAGEELARARFEDADQAELANLQTIWKMAPGQAWHGFPDLVDGYAMLDPAKVSIITPGVGPDGRPEPFGVPAGLVARFLADRGVVVEKTGFYSILVLFSIAVTRGKSSTLLAELTEFKKLLDANTAVREAIPSLDRDLPGRYRGQGLADLARDMHAFLSARDTAAVQEALCRQLPTPVLAPADAFSRLMQGDVELVPLDKLDGRVAATLCVLYPPGIPVIVPGERFDPDVHCIVSYLQVLEEWADTFPGFENEMQGVEQIKHEEGTTTYGVYCVKAL